MSETATPFSDLVTRLRELAPKSSTLLIAVDGGGAGGKTTFAQGLAAHLREANVVHFDDFYVPTAEQVDWGGWGASFDWRRLREQVLRPLHLGEQARYQRYDWPSDTLAEWHVIAPGGTVVIDGVYSLRPELRDFYDFAVWVETPREVRLQRGLERDGEGERAQWERWLAEEDRYISDRDPAALADLIVAGFAA